MNSLIRTFKESDLAQINQLFTETVHAINVKDYTAEQLDVWAPKDRSFERWKNSFKDHIVYVAAINDFVVGFGDITKDGYLDHLFTHKDFQRQGIAGAMLLKLEEAARNLGLKELRTEASITAKPFFEKNGFTIIREQDKHYQGLVFVNYMMHKVLK